MSLSRPAVSVVMPFAGERSDAQAALASLRALDAQATDQLILVDNTRATSLDIPSGDPPVTVVVAAHEQSPAHARNAGAAHARNEWILFLDADTAPFPGLISAFFAEEIGDAVGAVAGEVVPAASNGTLAARYGAARSFLGQRAHFEHPYRPRAAAANLLVRKAAFEELGGFYEGVRAGEDTDFSWRLQEAGWRLELRPQAAVEHRYRVNVRDLRRQWRGYAAGRAWLARRHPGFRPEPALRRALARGARKGLHGVTRRALPEHPRRGDADHPALGGWERGRFLALDVLLGLEELRGLALSNRPAAEMPKADVVAIADKFPLRGDPSVELASAVGRVRVEAVARPRDPAPSTARGIRVEYLEDDGAAARWAAAGWLVLRHPLRCGFDLLARPREAPRLRVLAPAVRRLARDTDARLLPLGAGHDSATAQRLARLAGRSLGR